MHKHSADAAREGLEPSDVFQSDEDWRRVKSESEAEGRLVDEQLSRVLLTPDYWQPR
jgi:hypothetical protein